MRRMLSKCYEHTGLSAFIPLPQEAPYSEYAIPLPLYSFVEMIRSIISFRPVRPEILPFRFNTCEDSLQFNEKVLEIFGYDFDELITSYKRNIISPGSEFRDPVLLAPLPHCHPSWEDFNSIITKGVQSKFKELSED